MEEIMLKLSEFSHNHHPSGVKLLANFIRRGIWVRHLSSYKIIFIKHLLSEVVNGLISWYRCFFHSSRPSSVNGREPTNLTGSWAAFPVSAVAPGDGLYHLQKPHLFVGQGFGTGYDLQAFVPWLHLILLIGDMSSMRFRG
jgi:hypothetical protein